LKRSSRNCTKDFPIHDDGWAESMARRHKLESTLVLAGGLEANPTCLTSMVP
jgi:hypothetical protein